MSRIAALMSKSGQEVPEWMLKLEKGADQDWKKLEKVPVQRKFISTQPKSSVPKRFLKAMEKKMRQNQKASELH